MEGTQDFRCAACGAEFSTREQLEEHNRQAHQMSAEGQQTAAQGFRCPACGTEFATRAQLEEHAQREHPRD